MDMMDTRSRLKLLMSKIRKRHAALNIRDWKKRL
jgi:hypothetical protein